MAQFIKKQGIRFYITIVSSLVAVIAMILTLVSSSVAGYSIPGIAWVVVATVCMVVLVAVSVINANKWKNDIISSACLWVAVILCVICFGVIVSARAYLVGTLWITVLDSTNPLAVRAMNTAAPAFIMYLVSAVLLVAGGFFRGVKNSD